MMPDREKVIKGLEQCKEGGSCDGCQFDIQSSKCIFLLHEDALALLKEQEETISELQNAYGYLQKQFFEAQDKLMKEQENASKRNPVIVCPHCGKRIK